MPVSRMDAQELLDALSDLAARLSRPSPSAGKWDQGQSRGQGEIEIVVVGGAAGILGGQLTRRLTSDCDVLMHLPKEAWGAIERETVHVARMRGLSENWLNCDVRGLTRRVPPDWRTRASEVSQFGVLKVTAIGRLDLIVMKSIAGRPEDRMDLRELAITTAEADDARRRLADIGRRHPDERASAEDAIELLSHDGGLLA